MKRCCPLAPAVNRPRQRAAQALSPGNPSSFGTPLTLSSGSTRATNGVPCSATSGLTKYSASKPGSPLGAVSKPAGGAASALRAGPPGACTTVASRGARALRPSTALTRWRGSTYAEPCSTTTASAPDCGPITAIRRTVAASGSVPSFFSSTAPDSMICTARARASAVLGSSRTFVTGWSNVPMRKPGTSRRRSRSSTRLAGI